MHTAQSIIEPAEIPTASARSFSWQHTLLFALAGPVALGALLGLEVGPATALLKALILPTILLGVATVMVPALYIGSTLTGMAPPASAMAGSLGRGFRACGLVMLGLAGPVLFLLATTESATTTTFLGICTTLAGVSAGLRIIFADLFEKRSLTACMAFAAWALVALGIGLHLYVQFMAR